MAGIAGWNLSLEDPSLEPSPRFHSEPDEIALAMEPRLNGKQSGNQGQTAQIPNGWEAVARVL